MTPPIVQRLREAASELRDERVSMQAMARAHGPEAYGTLLLLLAMPCVLPVPGVGSILGLGMAALAFDMWRGRGAPCLPRRVAELELSGDWARRVLEGLASAYALAGRYASERLSHVLGPGWRSLIALATAVMAFIIVLPIPFGNVLPALALVLIGLGLVFRDGVAVVAGLVGAGLALVITAGVMVMALVWGSEWILAWV
jgi:hypothetical protein